MYDVIIVGGGPAGLSAALALGRARRRVLLCDAGPRRNAAAVHLHNFVTRDGITPTEFREIGRAQLAPYPRVEVRDVGAESIGGSIGAFEVQLATGETVRARRILLCTGMIDELLPIEGFAELWGHSIFICPYCHAWEVQDRTFGLLATSPEMLELAIMLRAWTSNVIAFASSVPDDKAARLAATGVRVESRPIARLVGTDGQLAAVELVDGTRVPTEILFARPPQRHVPVVAKLGLALDPAGFIKLDDMRLTSIPGIFAGGDLTTMQQGAVLAAAQAVQAAAILNHGLIGELAAANAL